MHHQPAIASNQSMTAEAGGPGASQEGAGRHRGSRRNVGVNIPMENHHVLWVKYGKINYFSDHVQ